jgi:protein-tyrosine phosphatase
LVDIHSHVLYSLDDGSRSRETSLAMLHIAADSGTTDLVATPHANLTYQFDPSLIQDRVAELSAAVPNIRLHSGCDFHLSYDNIQDAIDHPSKYTINHQSYLLVEFSDLLIFRNTPEIFARLQDAGMRPIVTHPERNGLLRQRATAIESWVEAGALVQLTGQSLLGEFGRRALDFSRTLLDRNLVHFVASDAHDCEHRPPRLDHAHAWLVKNYSEQLANALCIDNPRATLTGSPLELLPRQIRAEPRKWYQIWR